MRLFSQRPGWCKSWLHAPLDVRSWLTFVSNEMSFLNSHSSAWCFWMHRASCLDGCARFGNVCKCAWVFSSCFETWQQLTNLTDEVGCVLGVFWHSHAWRECWTHLCNASYLVEWSFKCQKISGYVQMTYNMSAHDFEATVTIKNIWMGQYRHDFWSPSLQHVASAVRPDKSEFTNMDTRQVIFKRP